MSLYESDIRVEEQARPEVIQLDITQARQFLAIYEHGKITTASDELRVTQSTLSRSMQRLEDELGRPLFERSPTGSQLTQWGELLLPVARQIVDLYEDVVSEIQEDTTRGVVRLGAIPTVSPYYIPQRLAAFHQSLPGARVRVLEDTTDNLLSGVRNGEIDIAVMTAPIDSRHLEVTPLLNEKLLFICHRDHLFATGAAPRLEDLDKEPFIMLYEAHSADKAIMNLCDERPFHPIVAERTSQLSTVMQMVAFGHGVSIVPEMALSTGVPSNVVARELVGVEPTRKVIAVTNPYRYEPKLVGLLRDALIADESAFR